MTRPATANDVGSSTTTTRDFFTNKLIVWFVLAAGLMITAAATLYMKSNVEEIAEKNFADHCLDIQTRISERLEDHARILLSGAAFFNASDTVTRDTWRAYTQHQKIDKQLPGIQGIGFSLMIPRNELPKHIDEIRSQGFPTYTVRPDGDRELYSSIIYLEPFIDRNLRAFGYDMFSEPLRRAAMERARDANDATLSGKVILVQETGKEVQAGTLMYVPVYRKGEPVETAEQRRAAIYGWVYSPYRMNDLMQGILGDRNLEKEKRLHLQIYDGEQMSAESFLYSCHPTENVKLFPDVRHTKLVSVDFHGKRWTLRFTQTGGGLTSVEYLRVWLTLVSGILITLLLFALIRTLQNSRAKALRMVEERTVELRLSEEQLVLAQLIGNAGSWVCDIETGKIWGSAEGFSIFGFPPVAGDISIDDIEACIPERERVHQSLVDLINEGREYNLEYVINPADGSPPKTVLSIARLEKNVQGNPLKVLGFIQDITQRKLDQEALRNSEEIFSLFMKHSPFYTYIKEVTSTESRVLQASDNFRRMIGIPGSEMVGKTVSELFPAEMAAKITADDWCVVSNGDVLEFEEDFNGRNYNTIKFPIVQGDRTLLAGYTIDVTERKLAEMKLRASEERFQTLFDRASDGIMILTSDGKLIAVNESFASMHGYDADEMLAINLHTLDSPKTRHLIGERMHRVLSGESAIFEVEHYHKDGHVFPLEVSASMIPSDGETLIQSFHRDITERKQIEEKLQLAKLQAESANIAKSQFLSNMSHEIRTPMNGILGMTQLLEMTELTADQQEYVAALKLSGKNLLSLISDILDLSKIEAGKVDIIPAEFSLHHCINDVVLMQKTVAFEKHLTLQLNPDQDITALLLGDQLRIKQILLNLVGNAVKFTSQGSITISTKLLEQHDNGALIQIAVKDSGIGISPESLDTIFKPFTQEDGTISRRFGGTGLGLTISLRLAELMGGNIQVESTQDIGSCFTLTLPFTVGRETATIQPATTTTITTTCWDGPALRVLLVEDDQINIKFGSSLLTKMGFEVIVAENGRECLAALEKETFDLVLMDIKMPVMTGDEALCEIRSKEQGTANHLPVIAVTAYSMRGDKERFIEEGFDGYISKPLITRDLVAEMKRVVGLSGEAMEETHG